MGSTLSDSCSMPHRSTAELDQYSCCAPASYPASESCENRRPRLYDCSPKLSEIDSSNLFSGCSTNCCQDVSARVMNVHTQDVGKRDAKYKDSDTSNLFSGCSTYCCQDVSARVMNVHTQDVGKGNAKFKDSDTSNLFSGCSTYCCQDVSARVMNVHTQDVNKKDSGKTHKIDSYLMECEQLFQFPVSYRNDNCTTLNRFRQSGVHTINMEFTSSHRVSSFI